MAIKRWNPITNARRGMITIDYSKLTKIRPLKKLVKGKKEYAGRNNTGKITVRHRGGGNKRNLRDVDFSRISNKGVTAIVKAIEYDPNRTAFIARVCYLNGQWAYILASENMKVGDRIMCDDKTKVTEGNRMKVKNVPAGFEVYNIELLPGKGGTLARSAGASAKVVSTESDKAQIRMPSGDIRLIDKECMVTLGQVSNLDHTNEVISKAGKVRWMRRRPVVRGKAMNPCDHPHGGGEARNSIGMKYPKTPWGAHALGVKTRKKKKYSDKFIIKSKK